MWKAAATAALLSCARYRKRTARRLPLQVVLFGRSLGGAVAAYAASRLQRHVSGLVLENTFTSIVDLVPHTLPFLRPLVGPGR